MSVIPPTFSGPGMLSPFVSAPASGSLGPPPGPDPSGYPSPPDPRTLTWGPVGIPSISTPGGPDPYGDPFAGMVGSMSAMGPDPYATSGPPGYSYITGTIDPTAAEIIAAAEMSGMPIPPGMDPIAFSKMMSGGPSAFPTGPPPPSSSSLPDPVWITHPELFSAPTSPGGSPVPVVSTPTPVAAPLAPPLAATPSPPTTPIPTLAPAPAPTAPVATAAPLIPVKTVVPAELTTIAPKPTDTAPELFVEKLRAARAKSFGGIGGYSRCDPITGKCSNYA